MTYIYEVNMSRKIDVNENERHPFEKVQNPFIVKILMEKDDFYKKGSNCPSRHVFLDNTVKRIWSRDISVEIIEKLLFCSYNHQ